MYKILLIQPPIPNPISLHKENNTLSAPPIGLLYIASVLIQYNYDVQVYDMEINQTGILQLIEVIKRFDPNIIGITATTLSYKNAIRISKKIKSTNENIKIVLGGPHVTFDSENILLQEQSVDFIIRGEGEYSFLKLCNTLYSEQNDFSEIPGLTYRHENGKAIKNKKDSPILNLNSIPFPARYLVDLEKYNAPGTIITGRGCEGNCIFCAAKGINGHKYRFRSIQNVLEEIKVLIKYYNIKYFFFADDTFTGIPDRTRDFCNQIIRENIFIEWICETRIDCIDFEILDLMKRAGCKVVQFGIESGSQNVLDLIRKNISIDKAIEILKHSVEIGLYTTCSFLFPHPFDTRSTILETKQIIHDLNKIGVKSAISLTTPFLGTLLYKKMKQYCLQLIEEDTDFYNFSTPIIITPNFNMWEIKEIYFDLVTTCLQIEYD